jgi:hypothetical protein
MARLLTRAVSAVAVAGLKGVEQLAAVGAEHFDLFDTL